MASTNPRSTARLITGPLLALTAALMVWYLATPAEPEARPATGPATSPSSPEQLPPQTIASSWQWQNIPPATASTETQAPETSSEDLPFSAEAIFEALQEVRIDANGDVVLDNTALEALNKTFKHGQVELTEQNLEALQELIQVGLPGKAGEQTAQIVGDFYQYLEAKEGFADAYRPQSPETLPSDAAVKQQYEELRALRSTYLGQTVADQLFAQQDAAAEYMFKAREIQADPSLTPEQKVQRAEQLGQELLQEPTPTLH